jgi:hypothetical protein
MNFHNPVIERISVCISILTVLIAGCASLPIPSILSTDTPQPQLLSSAPLATPTTTATASASAPSETTTAESFALQFTPVPTETPLPTLELPTESIRAPAFEIWDGLPTYPAESNPEYYFRLKFDPDAWALTTDQYGFPALGHRAIIACIISPGAGRGLPLNGSVGHEVRRIGGISYQINTVFVNGVRQLVNYSAGDGRIYTAFGVSFEDRPDQCVTEAEAVLATLTSVHASQATPIATP